ncbi:MAG: hypothetical protein A2821_00790 [Candidatus Magasanikbacteria bacterium RIFCSPHIGHO2_01_FULL_41_23]|uniref:Heat-inducible transcription repressor HrcA C-terminal domain-containing protein n=1 Tax=Candidatus Magasanikbacteria bacterium RIFCSPLOWO2_01_FULL_40_15 TaxID=1798686 RepID=A0A1F6N0E1_9BACT|nr:MAG: hypothetical protein A2821_00790 [Candidatus Magasanikbacteria bacterium RIFCSPHIGHO2_01_FULL_41_23]OGH74711.1 MAG: hypothetical protein A3F22_02145 [Candidatus Magasanikbacteria bacterium RIFCSPHIGHO2_12_FULL_41_16]OGH77425.1 MAG: hypothetical protein A2983_01845 [Candidatus Magasanikbacteria bacterium RIFCSPLOWO2_01_FULL_40_15]
MVNRRHNLLRLIVESYIETAEPIGSKFLVSEYSLDMSDATVRNEMRDLEDAGFLTHPHVSAGRIPTETGYRFYVQELLGPKELSKKIKVNIETLTTENDEENIQLKQLGKLIAGEMNSAVVLAFGRNTVYYTGLSNLFSQPEFQDSTQTVDVSHIFDECEENIEEVFEQFDDDFSHIFIGAENPFGGVCSVIGARLPGGKLLTILGPHRMDYSKGKSLIDFIKNQYD